MRVRLTKEKDRCIAITKLTGKQCTIKKRLDLNQSLCTTHLKEIGFNFELARNSNRVEE